MVLLILVFSAIILLPTQSVQASEKIEFKSKDGLTVTADLYMVHKKSAPLILLFHQAGWSRGAYVEIAPKLNKRGFNCMAVDLRSGQKVNGVENATYKRAQQAMKPKSRWFNIYEAIPGKEKFYFIPDNSGNHGSRALWEKYPDHKAYWDAVDSFLTRFI